MNRFSKGMGLLGLVLLRAIKQDCWCHSHNDHPCNIVWACTGVFVRFFLFHVNYQKICLDIYDQKLFFPVFLAPPLLTPYEGIYVSFSPSYIEKASSSTSRTLAVSQTDSGKESAR